MIPWLRSLQHRLVALDDAHVAQRLVEEARVDQVHGGVLDAAGVGSTGIQ